MVKSGARHLVLMGRSGDQEEEARLAVMALRQAGAEVTLHWEPGGHAITQREVDAAHKWIEQCLVAHAGRDERARAKRP